MKMKMKKKKPSNPTSTIPHPQYFQMISEAITSMKNTKGSTQQAISKFIVENYGSTLPSTFQKNLPLQLRQLTNEGRVIKEKYSYKIAAIDATFETSTSKIVESKVKRVVKTKRLSQVKTPEGLKKKTCKNVLMAKKKEKMKRLSLVKTPEALKKISRNLV